MRRKDHDDKMTADSQGKGLPETLASGDDARSVRDLPPANPLGEPVEPVENYPNTSEAGKVAAALGLETEEDDGEHPFGETIVEHPLSPTDSNPNPHGQRSDPEGFESVVDPDTKVASRQPITGDVEIEATQDGPEPVHLGDGRTLAKGERAKVSKDTAGVLTKSKQAKRV